MSPCLDPELLMKEADEPANPHPHLAACGACRGRVERLRALARLVQRAAPEPLRALPPSESAPARRSRAAILLPLGAVAAFALLLISIFDPRTPDGGAGAGQDAADPLPPGALLRLGSRRFRHEGSHAFGAGGHILAVAHSPDGRLLASGGRDGFIRLWELPAGRQVRALRPSGEPPGGFPPAMATLAFSPDGSELAAPDGVGGIELWDVKEGRKRASLEGHPGGVGSLAYSPDGRTLASSGADKQAHLWDRASLSKIRSFPAATMAGRVAYSPDGGLLALADHQAVSIWNAATGERVRTLAAPMFGVCDVAFSPDGRTLASASTDRMIRLWDVGTGAERRSFRADERSANDVAWTPDGRMLATAGTDGALRFWDADAGTLISKTDGVGAIALSLSPDGRTLATAHLRIRFWEVPTGREIGRTNEHSADLASAAFSPDGRFIASGAWDGYRVWDARTGESLRALGLEAASPSVQNGEERTPPLLFQVAYAADGTLAGWRTDGTTFRLREFESKRDLPAVDVAGGRFPSGAMAFSAASQTLAASATSVDRGDTRHSDGSHITVWTLRDGAVLSRAVKVGVIHHMALSPDGTAVATGNYGGSCSLWDVRTGQKRKDFPDTPENPVTCLAFSPDGRFLASGHRSGAVRILDAAGGEEVLAFKGHEGDVTCADFARDGRRLVTGSSDGTLLVWSLQPAAAAAPPPLERLWEDLLSADARTAYGAGWALAAAGDVAVAFLGEQMRAVPAADAERFRALIARLGHDDVGLRERAYQELAEAADRAAAELRRALDGNPSGEGRARITALLESMDASPGGRRLARALCILERIGTRAAETLLSELSASAPTSRLRHEAGASLSRLNARVR